MIFKTGTPSSGGVPVESAIRELGNSYLQWNAPLDTSCHLHRMNSRLFSSWLQEGYSLCRLLGSIHFILYVAP